MKVQVDTQDGLAFITVFTFKELLEGELPVYRLWRMGDGMVYEDITTVQHTYKFAGVYNVEYSALDADGVKHFVTFKINCKFLYHDSVIFTQIPENYSDAGQVSDVFTISVTSTQINNPINISLFAINSNSIPSEVLDSKWERLVPRWRFVEAEKNLLTDEYHTITQVSATDTRAVTSYNTLNEPVTCAVIGSVNFRFVDDTSTGLAYESLPLLLNATLQTSSFSTPKDSVIYNYASYANSAVITATIAWQVNYTQPSFLKITKNIYEDVSQINWQNISIPFLITAHNQTSLLTTKKYAGISYEFPAVSATTTISLLTSQDGAFFTPVTSSYYNVTPNNLVFYAKDYQDVKTGGYVFGELQSQIEGKFVKIHATTSAVNIRHQYFKDKKEFAYPINYLPIPIAWVCNPVESLVTKLHITPTSLLSSIYLENMIVGTVKTYSTSATNQFITDSYNYQISKESGTYCIAIDPNDKTAPYSSIVVDSASDTILRFKSIKSENTTSFACLSSFITYDKKTQNVNVASISLDSESNIWLSLNNFVDIIKLDKDFKLLTKIQLSNDSQAINSVFKHCDDIQDGTVDITPPVEYDTGDFRLRPKVLETDKDNNLWVGCVTNIDSILLKFDKNGKELFKFALPRSSIISSFTIDYYNNLWAIYHVRSSEYGNSFLIQIDPSGTLLGTHNLNQQHATYCCVDRQSNIWYVHGSRSVGFFNTQTLERKSWDISTIGEVSYTPQNTLKANNLNNDFNSISIDAFDRLWVIDSTHNNVYYFNSYTQLLNTLNATKGVAKIRPDTHIHHFVTFNNQISSTLLEGGKSIYAVGDFTGNRWLQKYGDTDTDTLTLTGESAVFSVYNLNSNNFQIRKINENFNMSEHFKTLTVNDTFAAYEKLYSDILVPVVGDDSTLKNNVGLQIYEKIANFGINTIDIDTCEIQHLISHAKMTGNNNTLQLGKSLPVDIQRLLNITSISKGRLLGSEISYDLNKNVDTILDQTILSGDTLSCTDLLAFVSLNDSSIMIKNVEPITKTELGVNYTLSSYLLSDFYGISSNTYLENNFKPFLIDEDSAHYSNVLYKLQPEDRVKSGDELILFDIHTSKKQLFNIPLSCYTHTNTTEVSYISSMKFSEVYNFEDNTYLQEKYVAYTYTPPLSVTKNYTNNIIDWNNSYNSIIRDELTSDGNMWYGDNGVVECAFNNLLTRYLTVTSELIE